MAKFFKRARLPVDLSRVGDNATAKSKCGNIALDDPAREQVELKTTNRVPGVSAAINLEHRAHDIPPLVQVLQFSNNFGDKASLSLVAHADARVGDNLALKWCERHDGSVSMSFWKKRALIGRTPYLATRTVCTRTICNLTLPRSPRLSKVTANASQTLFSRSRSRHACHHSQAR